MDICSENLSYTLEEKNEKQDINNVTHADLMEIVQIMEITESDQMSDFVALEMNYQVNYTRKQLDRIAEYYKISRRKKKKDELIQDIVIFEKDPENLEVVYRRKKLWAYMQEIKQDSYLKKFLIFN